MSTSHVMDPARFIVFSDVAVASVDDWFVTQAYVGNGGRFPLMRELNGSRPSTFVVTFPLHPA